MPKMKTNRGAAKRFRRTAKGFKHRRSLRNHMLSKKTSKHKRHLRGLKEVAPAEVSMINRLLPKKAR
jgi:large subunit ribosomal protein L35